MTVLENVMVGSHCRTSSGFLSNALRLPRGRARGAGNRRTRARAGRTSSVSTRVAGTPVADLPFGTQKRVELARALASEPKLLLLDEPASGLNHEEVDTLGALIRDIRDRLRMTVLLVEHHMSLVMSISDKVVALNFGRKIAEGTPAEVQRASGGHRRPISGRRHERRDAMSKPLLDVHDLHAGYGLTRVLHGIDFALAEGSITTLLGANGAGKTTTLRALCAMVRPQGEVTLRRRSASTARRPRTSCASGIAHVPDGRGTFVHLSTEENLRLGAYVRKDKARGGGRTSSAIYGYFPRLEERRHQQAGTLSGGEQQMLAVSRALMLRPRLLLLDEPSFGLAPLIVRELFEILRTINQRERVSILLVEQNAAMALDLADHAYLIETGRIVLSGSASEMKNNDAVRRVLSRLLGPVAPMDAFLHQVLAGLATGGIYASVALALVMIYQATHLRQLRAGRDGDVLDLHRLGPDQRRHSLLGRLLPDHRASRSCSGWRSSTS